MSVPTWLCTAVSRVPRRCVPTFRSLRDCAALSTRAVDNHADSCRGIGFHALCGGAFASLDIFCPGCGKAGNPGWIASRSAARAFRRGFSRAALSTSPVDKLADTLRGIGFHALCDKACASLAKFWPSARSGENRDGLTRSRASPSRRFARGPRTARLSTHAVDKVADSGCGIGFHALRRKGFGGLDKKCPGLGTALGNAAGAGNARFRSWRRLRRRRPERRGRRGGVAAWRQCAAGKKMAARARAAIRFAASARRGAAAPQRALLKSSGLGRVTGIWWPSQSPLAHSEARSLGMDWSRKW